MSEAAAGRLFLALWPDEAVRAQLVCCGEAIAWPRRARRTLAPDLHLTLHFIGPVPEARWPALVEALAVPAPPITLVLDAVESWPNGIAALVPTEVPDALARLQHALGERLHEAGLPVEPRPYRPHVTLARQAQGVEPAALPAIAWHAAGYVLATSTRGTPRASPGARYRVLQRFA